MRETPLIVYITPVSYTHLDVYKRQSFDIAMQNELTLEENMELARKFVQEQFVAKGMIADLAFHSPEKEDGGIPNPHFHVMTTMRPLNPAGDVYKRQGDSTMTLGEKIASARKEKGMRCV